jgi:hypothetical protein
MELKLELQLVHYSFNNAGVIRKAWDRINEFCQKYESEADLDILFEDVMQNYFSSSPRMLIFVLLDNEEIVAHMLVTLDEYYGSRFITIQQYWKDPGVKIPMEIRIAVFQKMGQWGKDNGVSQLRIWAKDSDTADHFEKYGFTRDQKIIMNTSLKNVADRLAELPKNEEKEEAKWVEAAEHQ